MADIHNFIWLKLSKMFVFLCCSSANGWPLWPCCYPPHPGLSRGEPALPGWATGCQKGRSGLCQLWQGRPVQTSLRGVSWQSKGMKRNLDRLKALKSHKPGSGK